MCVFVVSVRRDEERKNQRGRTILYIPSPKPRKTSELGAGKDRSDVQMTARAICLRNSLKQYRYLGTVMSDVKCHYQKCSSVPEKRDIAQLRVRCVVCRHVNYCIRLALTSPPSALLCCPFPLLPSFCFTLCLSPRP